MAHLVIFNPPTWVKRSMPKGSKVVGVVSNEVHEVRYRHAEVMPGERTRKTFKHAFDPLVQMYAVVGPGGQQSLLIVGEDGQALWEDFDV